MPVANFRPIVLFALLLPLLATGCSLYQPLGGVQLQPVKTTTPIEPRFTQSYYYFDRDQNLYFILRSHSSDSVTGKSIDQVATIRAFWRPQGGVTTLNSTALNATFRYLVMTSDSVGMYEGAGFVRLNSKPGAKKFNARIMAGDLHLTQASESFVDTLGRSQIKGFFSSTYDDARALDMLLAAHREFFARSLASKPPGTQPSTIPATAPATTVASAPSTSPP